MTGMELWQKSKEFLFRRRTAYIRVFEIGNPNVDAVLEDLAKFCRATESTFHADERASLLLQGRQEVWLRLQHHLQLSPEQLWQKYSGLKDQT